MISPHVFAVKLSRGSNDASGMVLYKRNGRWGPVCGTLFDNKDAGKCTPLFLSTSLQPRPAASFNKRKTDVKTQVGLKNVQRWKLHQREKKSLFFLLLLFFFLERENELQTAQQFNFNFKNL